MNQRDEYDISVWQPPDWDEPKVLEPDVEPEPEVVLPTVAEVEAIRQQAYEEGFEAGRKAGFDQGHQQGHQQGFETGEKEGREAGFQTGLDQGTQSAQEQTHQFVEQAVEALTGIIEQFQQPLAEQEQQIEQALVALAIRIAKHTIEAELKSQPELIKGVAKNVIAALPVGYQQLKLYVNPDDMAVIQQFSDQHPETWHLYADDSIHRGGLRVQSHESLIDYTLQDRFKDQVKALIEQAQLEAHPNLADVAIKDELMDQLMPGDSTETLQPQAENEGSSPQMSTVNESDIAGGIAKGDMSPDPLKPQAEGPHESNHTELEVEGEMPEGGMNPEQASEEFDQNAAQFDNEPQPPNQGANLREEAPPQPAPAPTNTQDDEAEYVRPAPE